MRSTHWTWSYEDAEGRAVQGSGEVFPTQSDAEVWIGEAWRSLRELGVENAYLGADGEKIYGPMSLRPAD
ncbi:MAG: hypothetical protein ACRYF3_06450 [Janthinobacterium lividum]